MALDSLSAKYIDLTISEENLFNGAEQILTFIRPFWQKDEIKYKILTDGLTNKLVKCYLQCDTKETDVVLVRVYGSKTDLLIDRDKETRNIIFLSNVNMAPKLYATFNNGLVYKYSIGITLTPHTVREPSVYKLIAEKMADLHRVKFDVEGTNGQKEPFLWKILMKFYNLVPEQYSKPHVHQRYLDVIKKDKREFLEEINYLQQTLSNSAEDGACRNDIVFCHNDLLLGNVILNREVGSVKFIDFEYADFNYQAFDIANHFAEFPGVDSVDYSLYPNKELQLDWIKYYLERYRYPQLVTKAHIESMQNLVDQFVLATHLLWGLWALVQVEYSTIDFDYLDYANVRLQEYYHLKNGELSNS